MVINNEYNIKNEVKFDQHFLIDKKILEITTKIAQITNNDVIFEIGPGKGILTKQILKYNPKQLIAIEKDENLEKDLENLQIEFKDNFEYKLSDGLFEIDNYDFDKLIANIPYSITEPLYKKILNKQIEFAILLHGKTFYNKIISKNSKWNYFVNAFYDFNLIEEVSGDKFFPKTKVTSTLVCLRLKANNNLSDWDKFLQILYSKSSRNVKNALLYSFVDYFDCSKKEAKNKINELKLNITLYDKLFDNLSNSDFLELILSIKRYSNFND